MPQQGDICHCPCLLVARRPPSHILWNIKWPLLAIMVETAAIAIWEHYAFLGVLPKLDSQNLLKDLFKLVSFAMSLLLAVRLQRCYERWKEAQIFSSVVGGGGTCAAAARQLQHPSSTPPPGSVGCDAMQASMRRKE